MPSEVQTELSQYYRMLGRANMLVERLVTLGPELDASNVWRHRNISTHLSGQMVMLNDQGKALLKALEALQDTRYRTAEAA